MEKKTLRKYLVSKGGIWQQIFTTLYLRRKLLLDSDLPRRFKVTDCVDECRSKEDLEKLWQQVDELDQNFKKISDAIFGIWYQRPIPWQYEFVRLVSRLCNVNIKQTLELDAVIVAYCWGMHLEHGILDVVCSILDERFKETIANLALKDTLLKRNLCAALAEKYGTKTDTNPSELKFREILDLYLSDANTCGFIPVFLDALTPEIQLFSDERSCLRFSYYTPDFSNKAVKLYQSKASACSLFSCVHEHMLKIHKQWIKLRKTDNLPEPWKSEHLIAFMDHNENCIIDIRIDNGFYANVYIKRSSDANCMQNTYPDFIVYRKTFLYTVEMVDNFTQIPVLEKFIKKLAATKKQLQVVESKFNEEGYSPAERNAFMQECSLLEKEIGKCYRK